MTNELNLNKRLRLQLFSPPKPAQSDELELSQIVSLISQTRKQKPGFFFNFKNNLRIFFLRIKKNCDKKFENKVILNPARNHLLPLTLFKTAR